MLEFKLPDVAEGIHEAEILRWMVAPGEQVKLDQPMVEIQTDKSVAEIGAPVSGKVLEILAQPGTIARVGEVLVTLEPQGAAASPKAVSVPGGTGVEVGRTRAGGFGGGTPLGADSSASAGGKRRAQAAPAARKMAFELGIDIDQVQGTGPGGRVTMEDVRHAAERAKAAPEPAAAVAATNGKTALVAAAPALPAALAEPGGEQREPLVGLRRRIAERMELAWRTI
ncbi:MAG TPA: biotin/lipoyl-containing protein, partial [Ktedonobacterales bacterium]